jgi:hypothetical protein
VAHRDGFQNLEADAIETSFSGKHLLSWCRRGGAPLPTLPPISMGQWGCSQKMFRRCHVESLGDRDARDATGRFLKLLECREKHHGALPAGIDPSPL